MNQDNYETLDANEAVARVAYALNEVIAIYPITPASPMGEWADAWAAGGEKNLWGTVPSVIEMQSEGGAVAAIHGALQTGSLATTFTASQGLLLMIPNLFKIAGELTPAVFHIAARSIAAQALSIFGDHSDVMAVRGTGWAMLCSNNVQEAQDFALIAQAASLQSRIPFLHFFDGFRTSHEIAKIQTLSEDILRQMISEERILEHRSRALSPDHPVLRGTAQNPDVYFQGREAANLFYEHCPNEVRKAMEQFGRLTGRRYDLVEYSGAPDADRVVVVMGSAVETVEETATWMNRHGSKVGIVKVRLYRPLDAKTLALSIPESAKAVAVLDRTKEPGSSGEPLYLDVVNAIHESGRHVHVIGGRYGLSSKEFTPAMAKAVFDHLATPDPLPHFTVGIEDDVTHLSLPVHEAFRLQDEETFTALFYGLGSDGTVGANKESIKIIGENTSNHAQGYFVYDSKKAGAITVSHLRFGPHPIRAPYLIQEAHFVGCHQPLFLERFDVAAQLRPGGVLLLNSARGPEELWSSLPAKTQETLRTRKARLFTINAAKVAAQCGMGGRINTIMQACFFSMSGVLPQQEAMEAIRSSIRKTYAKKGEQIVRMNLDAVDQAISHLHEVKVPSDHETQLLSVAHRSEDLFHAEPEGYRTPYRKGSPVTHRTLRELIEGRGDQLPVSAMPCDGTFPTATARLERRNLATHIPVWDAEVCIQCGKCVMVCPHATIRSKVYEPAELAQAPVTFKSHPARLPDWKRLQYTLQIAPEDCTGCGICIDVCPAKNKTETRYKAIRLEPQLPIRDSEVKNWEFFKSLPEQDRCKVEGSSVREMQTLEPFFEFSGACAGCGETPYLKLLTQLFGDRLVIANATGCSSIYGGNLPTTPWSINGAGKGPAWSNSLFEDNAEFGYGFRVSLDQKQHFARELLQQRAADLKIPEEIARALVENTMVDEADIHQQRENVAKLKEILVTNGSREANRLLAVADDLVRRSVWIVGGDGWAYDIGYGGLDHILASGRNVKVLVLDTEVYSNTGGQTSKSTPRGAVAKFSAGGKATAKKDLGLMAMAYGNVYVASVAMGAKDEHTLKAFMEAESYDGPALIIAYSHCIAHGIEMTAGLQHQKAAVQSGHWMLYRHDPRRAAEGKPPLQVDSQQPRMKLAEFLNTENRYRMLSKTHPDSARAAMDLAQKETDLRWRWYQAMAEPKKNTTPPAAEPTAGTATPSSTVS